MTYKSSAVKKTKRQSVMDSTPPWVSDTLANGIKILHIPRQYDERFFLSSIFHVGSRRETLQTRGISHFLEHMMFRGSAKYPTFFQLAEAFEWLGGEWNAATGQEHTEYWFASNRESAKGAIALFAEFLKYPRLNDIEIERQIILQEIQGEHNEFGHSTDLGFHVANLFWPHSSFAFPILGTPETVNTLHENNLHGHRQEFYTPESFILCAVGGGRTEDVFSYFRQGFSDYPVVARPNNTAAHAMQAAPGPLFKHVRNSDNQYHLQLSFVCEGEWSPHATAYDLISRILADGFCARLAKRLREQLGLVYEISADANLHGDAGSIDINASISTEKLLPLIKELVILLHQLAQDGPTAEELERARRRSLVELDLLPTEPAGYGFRVSWHILNGKSASLGKEKAEMAQWTAAQIKTLCSEIFCLPRAALVVFGPERDNIENEVMDLVFNHLSR